MIEIFERLLAGDPHIASQFVKCKEFWEAFFEKHKAASDEELAKAVSMAQTNIEDIFNLNRRLAKEAMPITYFGSFVLRPGFETSC